MMPTHFLSFFLAAAAAANVAQGAQTVTVCSAGECLTGQSNITRLGAVLNSQSNAYLLLPGQYTSSVQPASLEQALVSATSSITFTTGFSNSTTATTPSLPLNVALQPGLLNFPNDLYTGDPRFVRLPQSLNESLSSDGLSRGSIILADKTVATIEATNNGPKTRVVLWDTVPYLSQLPYSMAGSLRLVSLESSGCSPACSSAAICTMAGTCQCPSGFTGSSCESCQQGFFGPQCQKCPSGCSDCDDGINGTGVCRSPNLPTAAPQNCNCANGVCSGTGTTATCTCSVGWATSASNGGTQCASCAPGFFKTPTGNCQKCGARCTQCKDDSGDCTQCDTGLVPSNGVAQICIVAASQCPNGQFPNTSSATGCSACNTACASCNGPAATDCVSCATGTFFNSGRCVAISASPSSGVCTGSDLVANPFSGVCDSCPLGCQKCSYDVFSPSQSSYAQVKCTACLPGKVLTGGKCADSCPAGSFAADGVCSTCTSACKTCTGKADFCTSCASGIVSNGTCVSTCPANSFNSNGVCTQCHPDCATCSGPGFNQCIACPDSSPVLTNSNRCVKTCSKSEYLDSTSGSCKTCDSSCASCSGGGASSCLSCNSNKQVLRAGKCVDVNCGGNNGPTSGLGVCLAELVQVPNNPTTPTIPPLDPNAQQPISGGGGHKLLWWHILLIVLGALLILILLLLLWRRRARQKRAQETEQFKRNLKKQGLWSKLWRNPFAAWWARRRSAAVARRSQDVERMSDAKEWKSNSSNTDRRTAVGVPKSISRGSWVTMGQHTERRGSYDGRSHITGHTFAGLGAIHENRRYGDDKWERARSTSDRTYDRSESDGHSRRYEEPRGESRYWGQEIEQEEVRSERTYDPYQYPRPDSRGSRDREDLVSIIKSEYTEGDRYDDRQYNNHQRSRTRDDRSYRGDYPQSVSTRQTQSRHYRRDEPRSYGRGESPSIYSQATGHPPLRQVPMPMPPISFKHEEPPRDAVLSSRFSMSTAAASMHPPLKIQRKAVPTEPVPELKEPPRQLTDAEMYKMSKIFPELLKLVSPTKKEHSPPPAAHTSPSRNPFRI